MVRVINMMKILVLTLNFLIVTQLINPTVRGSLNNATGISSGAGRSFDRDSVILHPLLRSAATNINASASADGSLSAETAILSGANSNHLQAYEDIIGGSAVRILESLLNQHQQRQQDQGESTSNNASSSSPTVGATALNGDGTNDVDQSNKDTLSILKEFQPMQTADRWIQEVQMVYISAVASAKASKLTNTLIARLIKIAQEEKEQGISVINEDNAETVPESPTTDRGVGDIPWGIEIENGEPAEEEEEEEEEEIQEDPEERVTVMVNGEEVDITGTGIDVEFLEALPDDLRAEVLSQQMAERRSSIQSIEEYELSPEFLAALPSDIRTEVLRQDSRNHRQSRAFLNTDDMDQLISNQQGTRRHSSIPNSAVNVTELEGIQMHPNLGLAAHAFGNGPTPTRDSAHTTWRIGRTTEGNRADTSANHNSSKSRKGMVHRDAIRIVDRTQLATLARLIFVPQSISKALLNRLLLNLCENSKTRRDLLTLLISILRDGNTDLAAVDRTFMQMTAQKNNRQPTSRMEDSVIAKPAAAAAENVPNLIIQRCLEILYYVVTWNDRSLAYFFTESTNTGSMKRRHSTSSRKSKTKTFSGDSTKYPILTLIGLLDQPTFLANVTLMEQLMNLLATICRPFPSLVRKYKEKTDDNKTNDDTNEKPNHRTPKPPVIPAQYLERIVDVLSVGECSSHTFQYTVSVLSYLSHLDGALDTIIEGLTSTANECGRQIIIDIKQLLSILDTLKIGAELEGAALAQFSATTSHQARLLRVLKAMDYLYTRKRNATTTQAENEKAVLEIYNKLDFLPLWKMLGACLKVIRDREDLINVASVLLPLVESFMAVSKYSTNKGYINTTQEAGHAEEFFITFTEEHKKILNIMVRNNPSLMSGSFSLLIHNPKMLEFDNKRNYFAQQLHKRTEPRERYPPLRLTVRRAHVFEDTYQKLQGLSGKEIKYGKLNVQFHNEEGVDAGGVAREWFSVLARQMFDPNYALFVTSAADKLTYQPNRASGINSEHLNYFKCVGRIIGKAIHDGRLLDAYFTRSFYKLMLGRSVDYRDIETVDPAYYKSLVWMLDNDITDIIDLTFSIEVDDFGTNKIIDLKPNGRHIPVTEANKHEYVSLITEQRLVLAIKDQVNAFLEGFHDIIPEQLIQIFNEQELELLISGLPDIDIDEWKANTVYEGYTLSSPQIQWFWRAVRSFDQEERAKLLQFSTGTSKVPLEGFAQLQGSNGVQKFQIHKEFGDVNRLPSAHTW
jgi:E3 ubiquitin-protein ligase HUWE1